MLTRRKDDTGATLIDLVVACVISVVLMLAVLVVSVNLARVVHRTSGISDASNELGQAIAVVGRTLPSATQVGPVGRSGQNWYLEALFPPSPDDPAGQCRQWRVADATNQLEMRSWSLVNPDPSPWQVVARNIVNDPLTQAPFVVHAPDSLYPAVRVNLLFVASLPDIGEMTESADFLIRGANQASTNGSEPVCYEFGRP